MRLAARQEGVLTRDQALACGMGVWQLRGRVTRQRWVELFPDVYRVEGAPPTWRQRLVAASLWAGRGFALSHLTAGALHGFTRCRGEPVELSVTRDLRCAGASIHRVFTLPLGDQCLVGGLRLTSVPRTLLDLAPVVPERDVRACVDQALTRKWTSLEKLERAVERAARQRGVRFLRQLVHEYSGGDGPSESELESRVLELFEAAGLPRPHRQRRVMAGNRLRRLDFVLPGTPVVVEADGYAYHSGLAAFEDDRARDNALAARGYRVLRWTWAAVRDCPDELVAQLCAVVRGQR